MRQLDRHIVERLLQLLEDEHTLRRLSGVNDGAGLQRLFAKASGWAAMLTRRPVALEQLIRSANVANDHVELSLAPAGLGAEAAEKCWRHKIELPLKRPFREAKVRIDEKADATCHRDPSLVGLLQDATEARELVMRASCSPFVGRTRGGAFSASFACTASHSSPLANSAV